MHKMAGFSDSIENIYSFPFTSSSLITFDLVHIAPNNTNTQRLDTRPRHSVFVNFVPGEGTGQNRTYNFKNKISLKFSLMEIESLSFVLRNNAETGGQATNPYKKFSNSQQGGSKSVSVFQSSQEKQISGKSVNVRSIALFAQAGNNKITIPVTPDQAYAISSALHIMFEKGTELEINRMMNAPKYESNQNNYTSQNNNNITNTGGFVAKEPDNNQSIGVDEAANQFSDMISNNPF